MPLSFAPPTVSTSVKLELDRDVHEAITAAIEQHQAQHEGSKLSLAEALSQIVNDAVRAQNGARARRK